MKAIATLYSQRPVAMLGFAALALCFFVWAVTVATLGKDASTSRMRAVVGPLLSEAFADPEISLLPCSSIAEHIATTHPFLKVEGSASKAVLPGVVLVTGNAGFIGNHLTRRLLKDGYAVIGLDALHADDDTTAQVQLSRLGCQGYASVDRKVLRAYKSDIAPRHACYVHGSLSDAGLLERIIVTFGVTHIVHLAAQAGVRKSLSAPESYLFNNIEVRR